MHNLLLVSSENCSRCEVVENILKIKGIKFDKINYVDLDLETMKTIMNKTGTLPVIYDKENKKLIELKDVI